MSEPTTPPTSRRRLYRLVAAVVLPLLALLVLEGVLRIAGFEHDPERSFFQFANPERLLAENDARGPSVPDPDIFWRMRPGWRTPDGKYYVRETGFRTPEFSWRKRPRTTRVVCIGDSSTFGMGVGEADPWTRRLEHALRTRVGTEGIDVLNLGVPGYTAFQGNVLMDRVGLALEGDVYVIAFGGFNDWVPALGHRDSEQGHVAWWERWRVVQLILWLRDDAHTGRREETADEAMEVLRELDTRDHAGERRVPLPEFERLLEQMGAKAVEAGARVVLIASGLPAKTAERNPIAAEYAEAVRAVARREGHALVDGERLFRESGLTDEELFVDFCHPTPRGHEILAQAVLEATGLVGD